MTRGACYLVDLADETPPAEVLAYVGELARRVGPGAALDVRWPGQVGAPLPPGVRLIPRGSGARALASAAGRATGGGAHLVVLLGPVLPDGPAIEALTSAFDLDPLVGFAQPRFADSAGKIWSLPCSDTADARSFPEELLETLPHHYVTTERLAACLAVRHEVVAWFTTSPDAGDGLPAALLAELCQARRRGYRNVVMNRVVVSSPDAPSAIYPVLDALARSRVVARFPDVLQAADWFSDTSHRRFEHVAAGSRGRSRATRVLLDCRGAQRHHNGTSRAILGLLDGLDAALPPWDVDLLFGEEGAAYHEVARRYPRMRVLTALPDDTYAAAVRLDQPWALSTVAELHRRSAAIAFNILDSIAWDVVYVAPPEVGRTWRFISEHADGLMYNSGFTRARFGFRFPVAPGVAQAVTHHSLHPAEYVDPRIASLPQEDHILVFGNRYDHKAVGETTELLHRAFPYRSIRAFGGANEQARRHNVSVLESGHLRDDEVDRLIATSRVVVFPSYYEGFGLPAMAALAYGRTVAVRASSLWRELAALTRMPGSLVQFVAPHDLVEVVGKALRGGPVDALPLGEELGDDSPPRWRDCARRLVDVVERIAHRPDARRWCARDQALELVRA